MKKILTALLTAGAISLAGLGGAVILEGATSLLPAGAGYATADPANPTPNPNPAPGLQYCPDEGWATIGAGGQWISGSCSAGVVGPYPGLPGPNRPSPFTGGGNGASGGDR
jgi:hypothetical protein